MKKLVFATNNAHKLSEVRAMVGDTFEILNLEDLGCHDDIPETAETLSGNALMKAEYIAEKYHVDCFADDTGLVVEALGGAPGVHTARYAYPDRHDPVANTKKLLSELEGKTDRRAAFITAIALIIGGQNTFSKVVSMALSPPKSAAQRVLATTPYSSLKIPVKPSPN